MSIHSSLRGIDTLKGERSVLSRVERIQALAKEGKLDVEDESASVYGLPKVRTKFKSVGGKKKKAAAEAATDEAAAEAPAEGEGEASEA